MRLFAVLNRNKKFARNKNMPQRMFMITFVMILSVMIIGIGCWHIPTQESKYGAIDGETLEDVSQYGFIKPLKVPYAKVDAYLSFGGGWIKGDTSREDGYYKLTDLPVDKYNLKADAGFLKGEVNAVVVVEGETIGQDIMMTKSSAKIRCKPRLTPKPPGEPGPC